MNQQTLNYIHINCSFLLPTAIKMAVYLMNSHHIIRAKVIPMHTSNLGKPPLKTVHAEYVINRGISIRAGALRYLMVKQLFITIPCSQSGQSLSILLSVTLSLRVSLYSLSRIILSTIKARMRSRNRKRRNEVGGYVCIIGKVGFSYSRCGFVKIDRNSERGVDLK